MGHNGLRALLVACLIAAAAGADAGSSPVVIPGNITSAEAAYPPCALECLATLIPSSDCNATDVKCLCTNAPLNADIGVCVAGGCTIVESLTTQNVSLTMCGAPVRDRTNVAGLVGVIGGAFALVAFLLRIVACSPLMGRSFSNEDYAIAAAVALTVPPTVFAPLLGENGLGKDIWTLPLKNIENILFYYFLGELFYVTAQSLIKISLILFLLRIFPTQGFRTICWGTLGFIVAYGVAFFVATLFQCYPINYIWEQLDTTQKGKCHDENALGWTSAIINIVLDLIILVLPLRNLYNLHLGLKKKIMTMFMFCLGIFVTIVSIVRLRSLITFANSQNITWDYLDAAYWSTIELHIGIITACLPAIRQFFIRLGVKTLGTTAERSHASSGHVTTDSKMSKGDQVRVQASPRRGDENDFIPLVDVEAGKRESNWGGLASTVTTKTSISGRAGQNFNSKDGTGANGF